MYILHREMLAFVWCLIFWTICLRNANYVLFKILIVMPDIFIFHREMLAIVWRLIFCRLNVIQITSLVRMDVEFKTLWIVETFHAQNPAGQADPRSPGIGETRLSGGPRAHPAWFSVTLQTEKDPLLLLEDWPSPEATVKASISRKQAAFIFISVFLLPRSRTNDNQSRPRGLFKCWQSMAHASLVCPVYRIL